MSWRRRQAYARHFRDRVLAAIDPGMGAYEAARCTHTPRLHHTPENFQSPYAISVPVAAVPQVSDRAVS